MFYLVQILVPVGITVVLPVLIVWIVFRSITNKDNKNAEIIIKAIENNSAIDADKLVNALGKHEKTKEQIMQLRLLRGCMFTFSGIAMSILAFYASANLPYQPLCLLILIAGLAFAIGLAYLVVCFVARKQ